LGNRKRPNMKRRKISYVSNWKFEQHFKVKIEKKDNGNEMKKAILRLFKLVK